MTKELPNVDDFIGGESKYLKADDLGDDEWELIVSDVDKDVFDNHHGGKQEKLIVFFRGTKKGLVMNVGNNRKLKAAYGATKDWLGKPVVLYTEETQTPDGSPTKGIRVRKPSQRRTIQQSENPADGLDDVIPF